MDERVLCFSVGACFQVVAPQNRIYWKFSFGKFVIILLSNIRLAISFNQAMPQQRAGHHLVLAMSEYINYYAHSRVGSLVIMSLMTHGTASL